MRTYTLVALLVLLVAPSARADFVLEYHLPQTTLLGVDGTRYADMDNDGNLEGFMVSNSQGYARVGILHLESGVEEWIEGYEDEYSDCPTWAFADIDGDDLPELVAVLGGTCVIGWDGSGAANEPPDESARLTAQIAPNPVHGACRLSFTVPQAGAVSVVLFDTTGRQIRVVLDAALPAGSYKPVWDGLQGNGTQAPAGVYFAKIVTPAGEETSKVVLTR